VPLVVIIVREIQYQLLFIELGKRLHRRGLAIKVRVKGAAHFECHLELPGIKIALAPLIIIMDDLTNIADVWQVKLDMAFDLFRLAFLEECALVPAPVADSAREVQHSRAVGLAISEHPLINFILAPHHSSLAILLIPKILPIKVLSVRPKELSISIHASLAPASRIAFPVLPMILAVAVVDRVGELAGVLFTDWVVFEVLEETVWGHAVYFHVPLVEVVEGARQDFALAVLAFEAAVVCLLFEALALLEVGYPLAFIVLVSLRIPPHPAPMALTPPELALIHGPIDVIEEPLPIRLPIPEKPLVVVLLVDAGAHAVRGAVLVLPPVVIFPFRQVPELGQVLQPRVVVLHP
jgi:hypothetical protein